jgi:hypothetical protein
VGKMLGVEERSKAFVVDSQTGFSVHGNIGNEYVSMFLGNDSGLFEYSDLSWVVEVEY